MLGVMPKGFLECELMDCLQYVDWFFGSCMIAPFTWSYDIFLRDSSHAQQAQPEEKKARAMDAALRRVCTPKPSSGKLEVSAEVYRQWKAGGAQRKCLLNLFIKANGDKDPHVLRDILSFLYHSLFNKYTGLFDAIDTYIYIYIVIEIYLGNCHCVWVLDSSGSFTLEGSLQERNWTHPEEDEENQSTCGSGFLHKGEDA